MKSSLLAASCALFLIVGAAHECPGAVYTVYTDRVSFEAALTGIPISTQDFDGIAAGTDLKGIPFLPGVSATAPFLNLQVWSDYTLFGFDDSTRATGNAYYEFNISMPYTAVGFDVVAWDPNAPGPANVDINFGDSTSVVVQRYQTSGSEYLPVFFGVTSDVPITLIRWHETPEIGGFGNEEVAVDNFAVALVPEPGTTALLPLAVALAGVSRRKR